jgi:hypothetical protein
MRRTKNNFCNKSCAATFNNKGKNRMSPTGRVCKECGAEYTKTGGHKSIFCPKCLASRLKPKYKTIGEYRAKLSVAGKHPSWLHAHIRILCRNWNKGLSDSCQKCKYSLHIEFAHIKPITGFPDSALLSEVNSPENLLVLCRNCHWEYDNGFLPKDQIPDRIS